MALEEIKAGSKASSKLLNDNFYYLQDLVGELSIKIDGSETTIDSKLLTVKNSLLNDINKVETKLDKALPIGSVIAWSSKAIPTDWIAMVGQSISTYTELVSVIGTSTLPDTRGKFLQGNATPLTNVAAGLPNITGTFSGHENNASGAFSVSSTTEWHGNRNDNGQKRKITFNASKSNAIYGKSTTVQPPAVTVVWIIKYQ